jgi:hypothetical protein
MIANVMDISQASRVVSTAQFRCSTALDRCIELSRFTC